jgi:hypothetical protein
VLVYDSFVHEALTTLGASDIHDFMDLDSTDSKLPFPCPDKEDSTTTLTICLQTVTIKKIISLHLWYAEQASADFTIWVSLTADMYNTW